MAPASHIASDTASVLTQPSPAAANAGVHVAVMGVAGCGKSAVGRQLAGRLQLPLIEGDDFHPESNIQKMRLGMPLEDADRTGWLQELGRQLALQPDGAVLTCSALKKTYRDTLREAVPTLRFVHLAISPAESLRRVSSRPGHFYPPSLVTSQFDALEDPQHDDAGRADGRRSVLSLAADAAGVEALADSALQWLVPAPR